MLINTVNTIFKKIVFTDGMILKSPLLYTFAKRKS